MSRHSANEFPTTVELVNEVQRQRWTLAEKLRIVEDWLKQFNEQRPHESLGDLTPSEFIAINSPEISTFDWH
jgi:transposase InsO family protein